jgi:hypothetical protein
MKTLYWSRIPGKFINKNTGQSLTVTPFDVLSSKLTILEWYETLVETLIDLSNQCAKEGLCDTRAMLPVLVAPDVGSILECTVLFMPSPDKRPIVCESCAKTLAVEPVGTLANRFVVTVDSAHAPDIVSLGDYGQVKVLDLNLESLT